MLSNYFRFPAAPFFSDFVLRLLTGSSFGARVVICSFVMLRSSRSDKFSASILMLFSFSASKMSWKLLSKWNENSIFLTLHRWNQLKRHCRFLPVADDFCFHDAIWVSRANFWRWNVEQIISENDEKAELFTIYFFTTLEMSLERDNANGPTQVHPALNYNDLTQHLHGLNGLNGINNGINGIIGNSKPFGERGELSKRF